MPQHRQCEQSDKYALCSLTCCGINHISHGDQLAACGTIKTCNFGNRARMDNAGGNGQNGQNGYLTAFPNPFTDFTTVRFKVPADQHASLKCMIFPEGQFWNCITTRLRGTRCYDLQLVGSNIAAGVYFLTLRTNAGESYTSKLTITK